MVSFNIEKVKHVSPLLIRKTDKWVTGQKLNGRIYFFNPDKTITRGDLFDFFSPFEELSVTGKINNLI